MQSSIGLVLDVMQSEKSANAGKRQGGDKVAAKTGTRAKSTARVKKAAPRKRKRAPAAKRPAS
jgi:hypothetical protein